jgi:hypothetical protein
MTRQSGKVPKKIPQIPEELGELVRVESGLLEFYILQGLLELLAGHKARQQGAVPA